MSHVQEESPSTPIRSSSRYSSPVEFDRRAGRYQAGTDPSSPPLSPLQDSSSEGYPSWLPKRPPPPAPRSTIHSTSVVGMFNEPGPSTNNEHYLIGRKPTPRSVRIVSLQNSLQTEKDQHGRRASTDPSRVLLGAQNRVWSRATSAGRSPTVFSPGSFPQAVRPRFRSSSFHPELLRNPSWKMRLWYYMFPVFIFLHLALQTFFDFNAVFILLLVAKYPNASAPGVPGSGRNWALAAAAYIACWATQMFVIFLVYELLYSFIRRWRVKRPLIFPLYLSSPAFNFSAMSSYTNFCFLYHIRASAFSREHGGLREGLAETCYYYSQNLPTAALLLPRAALSLALLLAFWSPQAGELALADAGVRPRDGTYFRSSDQTLTNYARGVLIANAAWTAWRLLVLFISWIGLWLLSGQGCAGLCGPRTRWEEDDVDKTITALGDNLSDTDALAWSWKECTLMRVVDAYEFCLTNKAPRSPFHATEKKDGTPSDSRAGTAPFEGMDKVLAAIGLGSGPQPARRGVLSEDLFDSPRRSPEHEAALEPTPEEAEVRGISPPPPVVRSKERHSTGPSSLLKNLPYPFVGGQAQVSSDEAIPFPPSPEPSDEPEGETPEDEDEDGNEHEEEEIEVEEGGSGEPSDGRRTSGSMSSLGHPIPSRYPFEFRRGRGRGSLSSASRMSPRTGAGSTPSRSIRSPSTPLSHSTQSTGNRESSDSPYPQSSNPSNAPSPSSFNGSGIPMPPRHPRRRQRAGTIPVPSATSSPSPVTVGRPRARAESARSHTESVSTDMSMTFGPGSLPLHVGYGPDETDDGHQADSLMSVPEAEGSSEEAERDDSVGLLSAGASPRASRTSLVRSIGGRRSNGSRSRSGTGSRSGSRSRTTSSTSHSESARSRAQSLIQSLSAASHSSLDLVRSRANSMVRLSDSPYYSSSPDPIPSSPENYTFGPPLRTDWREGRQEQANASGEVIDLTELPAPRSVPRSRATSGSVPAIAEEDSTPSTTIRRRLTSDTGSALSEPTIHRPSEDVQPGSDPEPSISAPTTPGPGSRPSYAGSTPLAIPGRMLHAVESMPDISTAHQSMVTGPPTVQGATDSSGRTPSSWGTMARYPAEHRDVFESS